VALLTPSNWVMKCRRLSLPAAPTTNWRADNACLTGTCNEIKQRACFAQAVKEHRGSWCFNDSGHR